jgi:soluble lytic murein transglycosylase-like protein
MSAWYALDPKLVLSMIAVESNFNTGAQSPKEAMGLMQLIPDTAERFNVRNAFDATQNLRGGMRYLRWLLSYYRGNITYAAAAYNAGEGRVDRYKGVPPYPETRAYVKRVLGLYGSARHAFDGNLTEASPWLAAGGR